MAKPPERAGGEELAGLSASVLDAMPIGLYVVDRGLRVVAWNRAREKGPFGQPRGQVLGRPLKRVLPARGFKDTLPILRKVFESGDIHEQTVEAHGGIYHVRRLPVKKGRTVTHVLSVFEDITEQRALEMRLIASDRLAYLGQLVAGVAHEVSNPLAGIAGCAEALASLALKPGGEKDRKEARLFRDLIREEVARCERIVKFLLDSARPDPSTRADLDATVGTALKLLERHPAFSRIKVKAVLPTGLPAARIDADSLKQVVMALAMNAGRAMPGGGTLTFRARKGRGTLVLDTVDTGPGVPDSLRARLFEPYLNADPEAGAGLALAVARSLVRHHGGDLVYVPRRKGSAFRVLLKAAGNA
ncbi:MAG TPA: ATP-binding protein [Vicinamibacteria bacterium]